MKQNSVLENVYAILKQLDNTQLSLHELVSHVIKIDAILYASLPQILQTPDCSAWLSCEIVGTWIVKQEQNIAEVAEYLLRLKQLRGYAKKQRPTRVKNLKLLIFVEKLFFCEIQNFNCQEHANKHHKNAKRSSSDVVRDSALEYSLAQFFEPFSIDNEIILLFNRYDKLESLLEELTLATYLDREPKKVFRCIVELATYYHEEAQILFERRPARWIDAYKMSFMFYQMVCYGKYKEVKFSHFHNETPSLLTKIAELEHEWGIALGINNDLPSADSHRSALKALREKTHDSMEPLLTRFPEDDVDWLKKGELLQSKMQRMQDDLKGFIRDLLNDAMACVGRPPCDYAMIGFGSLEKGSATLYSDLEFGILLPEAHDNENNRDYFRCLSHVLHVMVIRLGESPIPFSVLEINCDSFLRSGLCFDLGGKVSLGRVESEHNKATPYGEMRYELIGAPSRLLRYAEDAYFKLDTLLPVEVARCTHICGAPSLTTAYQSMLKERFEQKNADGSNLYQKRALTLLLGDKSFQLQGDLDKYRPNFIHFGGGSEGAHYDIKKEVYRLPDRLIDSLAFYYGIIEDTVWKKIAALEKAKVINDIQGNHLRIIDTMAAQLRLRGYQYYGSQHEFMAILPQNQGALFQLDDERVLVRFYKTAIPFIRALGPWANNEGNTDFVHNPFYEDNRYVQGILYVRLAHYKKAIDCLQGITEHIDELNKLTPSERINVYWWLSHAYHQDKRLDLAEKNAKRALELDKAFHDNEEGASALLLASSISNYGNILVSQGQFNAAKQYHEEALCMLKTNYERAKHPYGKNVAASLNNLAAVLDKLGESQKAKTYALEALDLCKALYKGPEDKATLYELSRSLDKIGNALYSLGEYASAKSYFEQALTSSKMLYGGEEGGAAHSDIATSFVNLGNVIEKLGDVHLAKAYYEKALAMDSAFYDDKQGKSTHPAIASILNNLVNIYYTLHELDKAKQYAEEAVQILRQCYGGQDGKKVHPGIAASLNSLGAVLHALKENKDAKDCHEDALRMLRLLYGGENGKAPHPNIAASLTNLANVLHVLGQHNEAIAHYEEALSMLRVLYCHEKGKAEHLQIAINLFNLANVLLEVNPNEVAKSRKYLEEARAIYQYFYPGNHSTITDIDKLLCLLDLPGPSSHFFKSFNGNERFYRASEKDINRFMRELAQSNIDGDTQSYWQRILIGERALPKAEEYNKAIAKLPNNFCKKIAKQAKTKKIIKKEQPHVLQGSTSSNDNTQ